MRVVARWIGQTSILFLGLCVFGTASGQSPWQRDSFNASNLGNPGNVAYWCGRPLSVSYPWGPGYGNNWNEATYITLPAIPAPATISWSFDYNLDTEPSYDFLRVEYYQSGVGWVALGASSGSNKEVGGQFITPFNFSAQWQMNPGDYPTNACGAEELWLRLRVTSDGAWSDEDGFLDTQGAAQIDNMQVGQTNTQQSSVYLADFETDEDGWSPLDPSTHAIPVADAGPDECVLTLGSAHQFDASLSTATGATISDYDWDFGDGQQGTGIAPSHTYGVAGNYIAVLTVTDSRGCQATDSVEITVCGTTVANVYAGEPGVLTGDQLTKGTGNIIYRRLYLERMRFRKMTDGVGELYVNTGVKPAFGCVDCLEVLSYPDAPIGGARKGGKRQKRSKKSCDWGTDPNPGDETEECYWNPVEIARQNGADWVPMPIYEDNDACIGSFNDYLDVRVSAFDVDRSLENYANIIAEAIKSISDCVASFTGSGDPVDECTEALVEVASAVDQLNSPDFDTKDPTNVGDHFLSFQTGTTDGAINEVFSTTRSQRPAALQLRWDIIQGLNAQCYEGPGKRAPSVNEVQKFQFAQRNTNQLEFWATVGEPKLRHPDAFNSTREFTFALDVDNNPSTGDPNPPLCGADYYVSIRQTTDGSQIMTDDEIWCWDTPDSTCCPSGAPAEWILTPATTRKLKVGNESINFLVDMEDVGNPGGAFCGWIFIDVDTAGVQSLPEDPCTTRLPIVRGVDSECPTIISDVVGWDAGNRVQQITVEFSEPMNPISTSDLQILPSVPFTTALDATRTHLTITAGAALPNQAFPPGAYTLTLNGSILEYGGANALNGTRRDGGCGTPYTTTFCIPEEHFFATDMGGVPTDAFTTGEAVYASGTDFPPAASMELYIVPSGSVGAIGSYLADQSDNGPTQANSELDGSLTTIALGNPVAPGEYILIADLNENGILDSTDRVAGICDPAFTVDEPCDHVGTPDAWWRFDEHSGSTAAAEYIEGNNGSYAGDPQDFGGQIDGAISLDGSGDKVVVPHDPALDIGSSDFAISAWIQPTSTSGIKTFMDKRSNGHGYAFSLVSGELVLNVNTDEGWSNYHSNSVVPVGVWTHVVASVDRDDPTGVKLYLNGALDAERDPTNRQLTMANGADLWIGGHTASGSYYWSGQLDELLIWKHALSSDEVKALYDAGLVGTSCSDELLPTSVDPDEDGSSFVPSAIQLSQNYPNPFNPQTTLSYQIPASGHVRILVVNSRGQVVEKLVDEVQEQGAHTVQWNARRRATLPLSSGVYFVHMQYAGATSTRKLVLLK